MGQRVQRTVDLLVPKPPRVLAQFIEFPVDFNDDTVESVSQEIMGILGERE